MTFAGINYLAVVAAAVVGFMFGGVWYGALSRSWMDAVGKSEADIKSGASLPALFATTFVALLVIAWVLAGLIGHLGPGRVTLVNGVISGAFAWLGFVATTLVVNHGYQGSKRALTLIDGSHWLGVLVLQGAVISWMGI